jgi:uncharacterized protein
MRHPFTMLRLSIVFVLLLASTAVPALAQTPTVLSTGLRVRGQGNVAAPPDVAVVSLGATVEADTAAAAFARTNLLMTALIASLARNGVAGADVQTRQFTLTPISQRTAIPAVDNPNPPDVLFGWRGSQLLSARVHDFGRLPTVVDEGVAALEEAAQVRGIAFAIEDTHALAARARAAALADARLRAEQLAAEGSLRLGPIVAIHELSAPPPTTIRSDMPGNSTGVGVLSEQVAVSVAPGEQTLSVVIEVLFALE